MEPLLIIVIAVLCAYIYFSKIGELSKIDKTDAFDPTEISINHKETTKYTENIGKSTPEPFRDMTEAERFAEFSEKFDREMEKPLDPKIEALIKKHTPTLAKKYEQLVYEDDYGEFVFDKWDRELEKFFKSVLYNLLPPDFDSDSMLGSRIKFGIQTSIREWEERSIG